MDSNELMSLAQEIAEVEGLAIEAAIARALAEYPALEKFAAEWDALPQHPETRREPPHTWTRFVTAVRSVLRGFNW